MPQRGPWEDYAPQSSSGPWDDYAVSPVRGGMQPPPMPAVKVPMVEEKTPSGFASKVGRSAAEFGSGVASAIASPIQTAKTIGQVGFGALQVPVRAGLEAVGGKPIPPTREEQMARALGSDLKERASHPLETLYNDPVGALADVSTLATGIGGVAGRVPRLAKVAQAARAVGNATDPIQATGRAIKAVATSPPGKVAGKIGSEISGALTGAHGESVRQAFDKPTAPFVKAMRGQIDETRMVDEFKGAFQNLKDERDVAYRQRLAGIAQSGVTIDLLPFKREVVGLLQRFNVGLVPSKTAGIPGLDFSRSTIHNAADQTRVNGIVQDVLSWTDPSPVGVDILKRRIGDFYSDSSQARALVSPMRQIVRETLGKQVPGYEQMVKDYETASNAMDLINKELSITNRNPGVTVRKLTTALRQNNDYRKAMTEALNKYAGTDLVDMLAGYHMREYLPSGITRPIAAGMGAVGGAFGLANPQGLLMAPLMSPRLTGETAVAVNRLGPKVGKATKVLTPASRLSRVPPLPPEPEIPQLP